MCGITGVIKYGKQASIISGSILKRMTDVIYHRGPDDEGLWISEDKKCGFGFRRLSIIDLSIAGHQPMTTPDGRYTIVFNGEIYNHLSLRNELESKGYRYSSRTDTESILYGFAEYGWNIVHKLSGMFSFAIWDDIKKELFCARDRVGKKPFYYTFAEGNFIFGSEIKSILEHPSYLREIDEKELINYLNFGMSSNRSSLFKGIQKIPAGHYLILKSDGSFVLERYWSPLSNFNGYITLELTEIKEEVLKILKHAIKDRMMSDVPFGVFLSGGIDSSLNVALMSELMDRPVDTYTVGFRELEKYNELEYARLISKQFNTNHHEILIDDKDSLPILQDLIWHEDEPNGDPVCIPLWFLSKLTRDSGTIVVQVGEGSDEQFVGYPWMLREYLFEKSYWHFFTNLPPFLRKSIYFSLKPLLKNKNNQILEYFRRGALGHQLYWGGASVFSPTELESLLNNNYHDLLDVPVRFADSMHQQALEIYPEIDYLQRILFVELTERLPEILLMRVDKIGMAHSIEARVPFLDHRLIEFTMSIKPEIKTPDRKTTKNILKKAVKGIIPDEIIQRKKQGFWAPVTEWLRHQWFDYSVSVINKSEILNNNIFNKDYINYLIKQHKDEKQNNGTKIFMLLELAIWYDKFFRNQSPG